MPAHSIEKSFPWARWLARVWRGEGLGRGTGGSVLLNQLAMEQDTAARLPHPHPAGASAFLRWRAAAPLSFFSQWFQLHILFQAVTNLEPFPECMCLGSPEGLNLALPG